MTSAPTDSGQWEELRGEGSRPLNLQEHTMVSWQQQLYVFGGEVGFSSGAQTPLWCYDIKVKVAGSNLGARKVRLEK